MKLLLDIGNTRIKWSLLDHHGMGVMHAHALKQDWRAALLASVSTVPAALWVSNVAGESVAAALRALASEQWHCPLHFVASPATAAVQGHVMRNAYAQPEKLGVDRWLAMVAAFDAQHTALVVSAGTALTLDAVSAEGLHLGGLIVPGPTLMQHSLLNHTSDIATRAAQGHVDTHFLADNTLGCITQGSLRACAALIDNTHARLSASGPVTLWITGGAAPALLRLLDAAHVHEPDLVLRGLSRIAA